MLKKIIYFVVFLTTAFLGKAQSSQVINFGIESESYILGDGLIDKDGNHIFICNSNAGVTISFHNPDFVPVWTKTFDFTCLGQMGKMIELSNGNYLACTTQGVSLADGTLSGGHLIQFNAAGDILWHKSQVYSIHNIVEIDQNRIAIGSEKLNSQLSVIDNDGNLVWAKNIDVPYPNRNNCHHIILSNDDHLIIFSRPLIDGSITYLTITKYDFEGNLIWEKIHSENSGNFTSSAIQTSDNNIYIIGQTPQVSDPAYKDIVIAKFDENGDFIASKSYGYLYNDTPGDLIETDHGNIIATGISKPVAFCGGNLFVMKIDENLDTIFTKFYGESGGQGAFYPVLHKNDSHIYTYGGGSIWGTIATSNADVHLIKTDAEFELPCGRYEQVWNVLDGPLYTAATTPITHDASTPEFLEYTVFSAATMFVQDACSLEPLGMENVSKSFFDIYPNPSNGSFLIDVPESFNTLTVTINNLQGKIIYNNQFSANEKVFIELNQHSGLFLIQLNIDGHDLPIKKIIITPSN
ncbi:MAG: hypothetical protein ACI8ZM_002847 [Crocinitomix sp.]|jgi:hypothetical protein